MEKVVYELDQNVCLKALKFCENSYIKEFQIDLGTTEMYLSYLCWHDIIYQTLTIPGTGEGWNWIENIKVWSKNGYKIAGWDAAVDILISKQFREWRNRNFELIVIVHSKSGPTGECLVQYFKEGDYLIAFCPAPGMRRSLDRVDGRVIPNAIVFIDLDDPVPKLGRVSFGHPKCKKVIGKNDPGLIKVKDHFLPHVEHMILNRMEAKWDTQKLNI